MGATLVALCGLLIAVASLVAKQGLWGVGSTAVVPGLYDTGSVVVYRLSCPTARGILPGPTSLALAGGFSPTEPPEKPWTLS